MLYFHNPGELDIRLSQLFGVNVKDGSNAIGTFGTGLKYAVAVTLRLGGSVTINSGLARYSFRTTKTTIRGKEFDLVEMVGPGNAVTQMPFTLELGKNWQDWMAYREFWANAHDEGGGVSKHKEIALPNRTVIEVGGLDNVKPHEFILQTTPLQVLPGLEIYPGTSKKIYYQGLKVFETEKPGKYTYNLTGNVTLTEDRTLASWWMVSRGIIRGLSLAREDILQTVLLAGKDCWEWEADWDVHFGFVPEAFREKVGNLAQIQRFKLPESVIQCFLPKEIPPEAELTAVQIASICRAKTFCEKIGHKITEPVVVVKSLGSGTLGSVMDGKIVLSLEVINMGTAMIAGTLLEEHFHAVTGMSDCTREFQNYLINAIVALGQEMTGEPL
jgi:hypothetical protein